MSFNFVVGVLNQEMFIILNKVFYEVYEFKEWVEFFVVMRCFMQILFMVQEMVDFGNEDDQDIVENVFSCFFYEEVIYDVIVNIIRLYKDQNFDYFDVVMELVYYFF